MVEVVARREVSSGRCLLLHDGLCVALAHDELLLDEGLGVHGTVRLLLGTTDGHVLLRAAKELRGGLLHRLLVIGSLYTV